MHTEFASRYNTYSKITKKDITECTLNLFLRANFVIDYVQTQRLLTYMYKFLLD